MLPKAHLTSCWRMSGSRWVITPLWLSGLWRSFLYSSSVYSCHLFLISSASARSIPFLSFIILYLEIIREGNGTPLQYVCLENSMDGGAWYAVVHWVAKSRTLLSNFTFTFHFHALEKEIATHSSVLAWRIPGTGEPSGLPSMRSHRVGHDWSDLAEIIIKKNRVNWGEYPDLFRSSKLQEKRKFSVCSFHIQQPIFLRNFYFIKSKDSQPEFSTGIIWVFKQIILNWRIIDL